MHNKSFTVDGAVTIVGGRNIGDEYFGAGDGALFADLDVLAVGPVARDVENDFERYWSCESAYPAKQILPILGGRQRAKLEKRASIVESDPSARQYVERLRNLPLLEKLLAGTLEFEWAKVWMISDDPGKVLADMDFDNLLAGKLDGAMGEIEHEMAIISGYFVPGEEGTEHLSSIAASGVDVKVLTNGYSATDVGIVHAGYAPWREKLLRAGVRLFEMTAETRDLPTHKERRKGRRLGIGSRLQPTGSGSIAILRSGGSTVHAKTIAVDRDRLFVGSFNFDPRSLRLNTEMGFVIYSPNLAGQVAGTFDATIPDAAYEVTVDQAGQMRWTMGEDEQDSTIREPGVRIRDKLLISIVSRLPIGWLL